MNELDANANNCKKFWNVIKEVIPTDKQHTRQDIFLKDKGRKVGKENVATFINDYFINVGNFDSPGSLDLTDNEITLSSEEDGDESVSNNYPSLDNFSKVSESQTYRIVKEINVSKSSGLDNVSSYIVKEAFLALIPEVTFMYNLSLSTSVFPMDWKKATVVPIPKAGDLTQVHNFRPISLLPLLGKILEKMVHSQIANYLEANSLLIDSQHGFRAGHSTAHSIEQLTTYISTKQDSRLPTLATYIDFRKAFDCVQHPMLLKKLSRMNLGIDVVRWVESYLKSRVQRVFANNNYSSYTTITQGVPQGSVLGPLFYIVYANDLVNTIKHCRVAMYADDTVLYTSNGDFNLSVENMQRDMDSIAEWCNINGIHMNTDKTKVMALGSKSSLGKLPAFDVKLGVSGSSMSTRTNIWELLLTVNLTMAYTSIRL